MNKMSYECNASEAVNIDYARILMTEDSDIKCKSVRMESQCAASTAFRIWYVYFVLITSETNWLCSVHSVLKYHISKTHLRMSDISALDFEIYVKDTCNL